MIINNLGMSAISSILSILLFSIFIFTGINKIEKPMTEKQKDIKFTIMLTSLLLSVVIMIFISNMGWSWCPSYSYYFIF